MTLKYGTKVRVKSSFYEDSEFEIYSTGITFLQNTRRSYYIADKHGPLYEVKDGKLELALFFDSDLEIIN